MTKINTNEIEPTKEIQTELEILRWTGEIQASIKDNITSDAILAHLNEKQKEYIKEMTVNAYFIRNILCMLKDKQQWQWQNNKWTTKPTDNNKIDKIAEQAFNSYMTQIQMECILNRNTKNNWLVAQFAKAPPEPEHTETPQEPTKKLWDAITKKKNDEEQEI